MIYQLSNGKVIELSIEAFLSMSDEDLRDLDLLSDEFSINVSNPFFDLNPKNIIDFDEDFMDVDDS